MKKFLGIDVGGGSVKGTVISKTGKIYFQSSIKTNPIWTNEEFLENIKNFIFEIKKNTTFEKIGIGTPGPIDLDSGVILKSANLPNLKNVNLISFLKEIFPIPIYFNNDSNVASLGEYFFGIDSKKKSLFVFTLGTGLGGGFIFNGKLYNGIKGNGMEVGHMSVIPNGAICGCGQKGCAESYFSTSGFLNRYFEATNIKLQNAKEFFDLVILNDKDAKEVLELGVETFSECIRAIIYILNPEKIVFLGGISKSYSLFGKSLEEKVRSKIFPVLSENLIFAVGEDFAGSLGSAALCFEGEDD